jgi:hypothetical protein
MQAETGVTKIYGFAIIYINKKPTQDQVRSWIVKLFPHRQRVRILNNLIIFLQACDAAREQAGDTITAKYNMQDRSWQTEFSWTSVTA